MAENMRKYKELAEKHGAKLTEEDIRVLSELSDDELGEVSGGCSSLERELETVKIDLKNYRDWYAVASMPIHPGTTAPRIPSACTWLPGVIAELEAKEKALLAAMSK